MASERQKCLQILGLSPSASEDDIKKAYKTMARQYHPDKNSDSDAKAQFQEISYAYKYLIDGPQAFNQSNGPENADEFFQQMFRDIFFSQYMYRSGQGYFTSPFGFFMESDDDEEDDDYYVFDDDYYFYDSEDEREHAHTCGHAYCSGHNRKGTSETPRYVPPEAKIGKKKMKKLEKRKRQRERQKEKKKAESTEKTQGEKKPSVDVEGNSPSVNSEDPAERALPKAYVHSKEDSRQFSTEDKIREGEKKKREKEEKRKRDQEARELTAALLKKQKEKQEREREKRKEKERKDAEEKLKEQLPEWFYEDASKSKKGKQRDKKKQEAKEEVLHSNTGSNHSSQSTKAGNQLSDPKKHSNDTEKSDKPLGNMDFNNNNSNRTKEKRKISGARDSGGAKPKVTKQKPHKASFVAKTDSQFRNRFGILDELDGEEDNTTSDSESDVESESEDEPDGTSEVVAETSSSTHLLHAQHPGSISFHGNIAYSQTSDAKHPQSKSAHVNNSHGHTSHIQSAHVKSSRSDPSHGQAFDIHAANVEASHGNPSHNGISHDQASHIRPSHVKGSHENPSYNGMSHDQASHIKPSHATHIKSSHAKKANEKTGNDVTFHVRDTYNTTSHIQTTEIQAKHSKISHDETSHSKSSHHKTKTSQEPHKRSNDNQYCKPMQRCDNQPNNRVFYNSKMKSRHTNLDSIDSDVSDSLSSSSSTRSPRINSSNHVNHNGEGTSRPFSGATRASVPGERRTHKYDNKESASKSGGYVGGQAPHSKTSDNTAFVKGESDLFRTTNKTKSFVNGDLDSVSDFTHETRAVYHDANEYQKKSPRTSNDPRPYTRTKYHASDNSRNASDGTASISTSESRVTNHHDTREKLNKPYGKMSAHEAGNITINHDSKYSGNKYDSARYQRYNTRGTNYHGTKDIPKKFYGKATADEPKIRATNHHSTKDSGNKSDSGRQLRYNSAGKRHHDIKDSDKRSSGFTNRHGHYTRGTKHDDAKDILNKSFDENTAYEPDIGVTNQSTKDSGNKSDPAGRHGYTRGKHHRGINDSGKRLSGHGHYTRETKHDAKDDLNKSFDETTAKEFDIKDCDKRSSEIPKRQGHYTRETKHHESTNAFSYTFDSRKADAKVINHHPKRNSNMFSGEQRSQRNIKHGDCGSIPDACNNSKKNVKFHDDQLNDTDDVPCGGAGASRYNGIFSTNESYLSANFTRCNGDYSPAFDKPQAVTEQDTKPSVKNPVANRERQSNGKSKEAKGKLRNNPIGSHGYIGQLNSNIRKSDQAKGDIHKEKYSAYQPGSDKDYKLISGESNLVTSKGHDHNTDSEFHTSNGTNAVKTENLQTSNGKHEQFHPTNETNPERVEITHQNTETDDQFYDSYAPAPLYEQSHTIGDSVHDLNYNQSAYTMPSHIHHSYPHGIPSDFTWSTDHTPYHGNNTYHGMNLYYGENIDLNPSSRIVSNRSAWGGHEFAQGGTSVHNNSNAHYNHGSYHTNNHVQNNNSSAQNNSHVQNNNSSAQHNIHFFNNHGSEYDDNHAQNNNRTSYNTNAQTNHSSVYNSSHNKYKSSHTNLYPHIGDNVSDISSSIDSQDDSNQCAQSGEGSDPIGQFKPELSNDFTRNEPFSNYGGQNVLYHAYPHHMYQEVPGNPGNDLRVSSDDHRYGKGDRSGDGLPNEHLSIPENLILNDHVKNYYK